VRRCGTGWWGSRASRRRISPPGGMVASAWMGVFAVLLRPPPSVMRSLIPLVLSVLVAAPLRARSFSPLPGPVARPRCPAPLAGASRCWIDSRWGRCSPARSAAPSAQTMAGPRGAGRGTASTRRPSAEPPPKRPFTTSRIWTRGPTSSSPGALGSPTTTAGRGRSSRSSLTATPPTRRGHGLRPRWRAGTPFLRRRYLLDDGRRKSQRPYRHPRARPPRAGGQGDRPRLRRRRVLPE
jgi:hypothetical protein